MSGAVPIDPPIGVRKQATTPDFAAPAARRDEPAWASGAWMRIAVAMFVMAWGGNQFTPLLLVYRHELGYSQLAVDVLLGAYVVGLIPGLLLAAALSESMGRRPMLLLGLGASLLGAFLLALGEELGFSGIFLGRSFSGVAVGVAMSVGTSWISELFPAGGGARRSTMALTGGFAVGPASAALLAEVLEPPLLWPYLTHAALCLPALWLLVGAKGVETRRPGQRRESRMLRVTTPTARHGRFLRVVVPMAPWIFGSAGIAYAIVPQQVSGALGDNALVYTAVLTVATLGTGVAVQPVARRLDDLSSARAVVVSMGLMTAGVALAAVTSFVGSPYIAIPVAILLGAAYGIAVVSGLLEVQRIAPPDDVARLTGAYYALAYVGFLVPAALAALGHWFSYPSMLTGLAVIALSCTLACASGWSKHLPSGTVSTHRRLQRADPGL